MRKKVFSKISIICVVSFILSLFSVVIGVSDNNFIRGSGDKLISDLMGELSTLNKNEKVEIILWMNDIDFNKVDKQVKDITGDDIKSLEIANESINFNYFLKNSSECLNNQSLYNAINTTKDIEHWTADTESGRKELNTRVDRYINSRRKIAAKEYKKSNDNVLESLNINKENVVFTSKYSPLAIIKVAVKDVPNIVNNDSVIEAKLCKNNETYETDEASRVYLNRPSNLTQHKAAIGIVGSYASMLDNVYNGSGIKIGQVEPAFPDLDDSYLSGKTIKTIANPYYAGQSTEHRPHATCVARVLVGKEGMAKGASLYCAKYDFTAVNMGQYSSFFYSVESLINNNVNIINMSAGFARKDAYDILEKWTDHIVNVHSLTFVKSAGNNTTIINAPGLAYNIITVGSIDDKLTTTASDDTLGDWSCYANYGNDGCSKPDFVTPGNNFFGTAGTSFSTPMVTGVIASMMHISPALKNKPMVVKALLTASCNRKVSGETLGGLTAKQGAGVIDYGEAVWMLMNGRYSEANTGVSQHRIYISTETAARRRVALAWLRKNYVMSSSHLGENNVVSAPYTNLDLSVYTDSGILVGKSELINSSVELVNQYTGSINGYYRINTIKNPSNAYGTNYALAWY